MIRFYGTRKHGGVIFADFYRVSNASMSNVTLMSAMKVIFFIKDILLSIRLTTFKYTRPLKEAA